MTREPVSTRQAPAAIGPYSQAIKTDMLVFASGQLGIDPQSGQLAAGVEAQTRQAIRNLAAVLEAAGSSLEHIVKTTIFVADMADFAAVNGIYGAAFAEAPPARSTVQAAALPLGGLVEIEAIALLP
ncbi:MAG: RidA family protein [Chloroflexota bacterium]|nr:RidA family protein [Chloroflexota bacterium]